MIADCSVLIPAHNAAETIGAAIESALSQEGVDVDVVVCDDGSTDDTLTVVKNRCIEANLPENQEARVFRHDSNLGQVAALNMCGGAAQGRYFIELDADDTLAPGALAALVQALDNAPPHVGFAYGQTVYRGDLLTVHAPPAFKRDHFYTHFPSLYAFMYRRETWDAGCRYHVHMVDDGKPLSIQDWDMALQLIEHMRYDGLCLRNTPVLNYSYHAGYGVGADLKAHNDALMQAFKARWPKVRADIL